MNLIVRQSTVRLSHGAGWQWDGWDGVVKLSLAPNSVSAAGERAVLESDILAAIAQQAAGKPYKATGFADTSGVAAAVQAAVNKGTLAKTVLIDSREAVLDTTEGTFKMMVGVPSNKILPNGAPLPDPVPVKSGTWKIDRPQQSEVTAQ